jgi:hypothetical protein
MRHFKGSRRKLVAGSLAVLVLASGGGALAATELHSPSAKNSAVSSNAANQPGATPSALSSARPGGPGLGLDLTQPGATSV